MEDDNSETPSGWLDFTRLKQCATMLYQETIDFGSVFDQAVEQHFGTLKFLEYDEAKLDR